MNKQLKLEDFSTHEKFILRLTGDGEQKSENEKIGVKITGCHARKDANYLTSLKLLEYCADSRYRLTGDGRELYLLDSLKFNKIESKISEKSTNELLITS